MEQMEKYYRVYADFKEAIDKIDSHRYMTAAQTLADVGKDSHIGKVYYRVVDLDWVEAIESTLVYIDKAIREQRRFIEVTEEVVPIEKERNITTESVRHLAQHTNLIARVEGSDVTPERILNIQREESFAIYENRFLYTLLQKLAYFVGLRYKALSDAPNDSFSKVQLHRDFQVFDEKVEYDLSFSLESHTNTKVDLNADVTTLSGYERVLRIRTVLGDFLSTPLMRELTGCEPVRPPILHTNLMTKNPNFKKSLDLWNYIETYTKPGYQAAGNEFDGVLADRFKTAIYDTVVLQQFAIELCSNPDLEEQLREEYEEQKRNEEEARKAAEDEKFRLYEQKAELAVLQERDALREEIEGLNKTINSLKKEVADLTVDTENKERKIQRLTSEVKHLEKEVSDRETRILNMQLELDRKTSELEAAKKEAEKFKAKFQESEAKVAELEAKLPALEEKIAKQKAELAAAAASIAALTADVAAKEATIDAKNAEIVSLGEQVGVGLLEEEVAGVGDEELEGGGSGPCYLHVFLLPFGQVERVADVKPIGGQLVLRGQVDECGACVASGCKRGDRHLRRLLGFEEQIDVSVYALSSPGECLCGREVAVPDRLPFVHGDVEVSEGDSVLVQTGGHDIDIEVLLSCPCEHGVLPSPLADGHSHDGVACVESVGL